MSISDLQLARWMARQRQSCPDLRRRALLEKIPGWSWNIFDDAWEEGFKQIQKHGPLVGQTFVTKDGYKLGRWIRNQRTRCKDPELRKRLETIPDWSWNRYEDAWEEGFRNLQERGMVGVKTKPKKGEYDLGKWIDRQRQSCKDPELRKRLETIPGWSWNPHDEAWEFGFRTLQKYGPLVGRKFKTESGYWLGKWIENQRAKCTDPNRRKRLESIKGWTWYPMNAKARRK